MSSSPFTIPQSLLVAPSGGEDPQSMSAVLRATLQAHSAKWYSMSPGGEPSGDDDEEEEESDKGRGKPTDATGTCTGGEQEQVREE